MPAEGHYTKLVRSRTSNGSGETVELECGHTIERAVQTGEPAYPCATCLQADVDRRALDQKARAAKK